MISNPPHDPAPDRADDSTTHVLPDSSLTGATGVTKDKIEKEVSELGAERVGTASDCTSDDDRTRAAQPQRDNQEPTISEPTSTTTSESQSLERDLGLEGEQVLENSLSAADNRLHSETEAKTTSESTPIQPPRTIPPPQALTPPKVTNGESKLAALNGKNSKPQSWHHVLATDILDKQYRLYSWNDNKSLSLITTNSLLLAAIGFLFKECIPDGLALLAILIALFFVALSLYFSLKQVIPQGSSGKSGKGPNVRALRSITEFEKWEDYHSKLLSMDDDEAFECAARQIYGMALNNDASRKITTRGVKLTCAGILFILVATVGVALSAREIHLLGQWAQKSPEIKPIVEKTPNAVANPTEANGASSPITAPSPSASVSPPGPRKQSKTGVKEN